MKIELTQGSQAWIDFRRTRVTSTDVSCATGRNPYTTARECWQRKLGIIPEQTMNANMERGKLLEEEARELAIKELAIYFEPEVHVHSEHHWAMASLDGIDLDGDSILEVKCPKTHHATISAHYRDQIQWAMHCSNAKRCYFVSYCEGTLKIFVEERNEAYINELFHVAQEFRRMLLEFEEPQADKEYLPELLDLDAVNMAVEYELASRQADHYAQLKEELKSKLVAAADGKSVKCCGLKIQKIVRQGSVDYSKIPELKGIDTSQYRKPDIETWRISK